MIFLVIFGSSSFELLWYAHSQAQDIIQELPDIATSRRLSLPRVIYSDPENGARVEVAIARNVIFKFDHQVSLPFLKLNLLGPISPDCDEEMGNSLPLNPSIADDGLTVAAEIPPLATGSYYVHVYVNDVHNQMLYAGELQFGVGEEFHKPRGSCYR